MRLPVSASTPARALAAAAGLALSAGCNIARIVDKSTMTTVAPRVMATPDVGLGCATGAAMAPVLGALGKEAREGPNKSLVLTYMSAAMCTEPLAWDTELKRMQAARNGNSEVATDLLEIERRQHAEAAARYRAAWEHLNLAFGPVGEGCPSLDSKRNDDLLFLLGLSSGLLAVVHDQAGGMRVGVPLDLTLKVQKAAACLDNETWWGVPSGLNAAVAALVPGQAEGVDPMAALAAAAEQGDKAGIRLARAFQVQTLATVGDTEGLKAAIAAHAAVEGAPGSSPDFRLLNNFATQLIRHESDKLWMNEVGHRTPGAQFGTFPAPPVEIEGLDSLLDSFLPPTETPDATDGDQAAPEESP